MNKKETQAKEFVIATEKESKTGISISLSGMRLNGFLANPVMFYNHQQMEPPIGVWENVRVSEGKLLATPNFDMEDETGATVARKVESGFLRAASVGIVVEDYKWEPVAGRDVLRVTRCSLIEASIVNIPANEECTVFFLCDDGKMMSMEEGILNQSFKHLNKPEMTEDLKKIQAEMDTKFSALEQKIEALASTIEKGVQTATQSAEKAASLTEVLAELKKNQPQQTEDRTSWTFQDYRHKDTAGLIKLKSENPERYRKLAAAAGIKA